MPLATAINLGIPSPLALHAKIVNSKIAAAKENELDARGGLGTQPQKFIDTGYSSNRGILCEKEFVDTPERILLFQFNPETISDNKVNNYETKNHTGFTFVDYPWISGGERDISFELYFDATAGANTPHFNRGRNTSPVYGAATYDTLDQYFPNGTADDLDILRSFMYPKVQDPTTPRFTKGGHIPAPKFMPPPVLIFSYGPIYLEGFLVSCPIEHLLVDKSLTPRRSKATVTFKVIESYVPEVQNILSDKSTKPISKIDRSYTRYF